MRPSKLYPFRIPANGSINLMVEGDYFKIKSSTGSMSITGDSFGTLANLLAGQGLRETNFKLLTLTDETGATNNGYLLVSDSTFIDDRITGEVSVIDGGKARTSAGTAFSVVVPVASLAGNFSHTQLWNPAGSGKNLFVEQLNGSWSASATSYAITRSHTAALSTAGPTPQPKKLGSAVASIAQTFTQQSAAQIGASVNMFMTSSGFVYVPREPIQVPPGFGLVMAKGLIAEDITSSYEWFEESV